MRWRGLNPGLYFLAILVMFLIPGCKTCETTNTNTVGTLMQYDGCKPAAESITGYETGISSNEDCIEYSFDGQILTLNHINSAFNCCPGEITADIDIKNKRIIISEKEKEAGCLCLCLFDLEYEIRNIDSGEYIVIINQLYLESSDQVFEFTLQLTPGASGTYCLPRNHYPWAN